MHSLLWCSHLAHGCTYSKPLKFLGWLAKIQGHPFGILCWEVQVDPGYRVPRNSSIQVAPPRAFFELHGVKAACQLEECCVGV